MAPPDPVMNRAQAARLVMEQARPPVVALLQDLGFRQYARELAAARSPGAVRHITTELDGVLRARLRFPPVRRAARKAVGALGVAARLAANGDVSSTAVQALSACTAAARAQAWLGRWWQLRRWPVVRARVLAEARAAQVALLGDGETAPPEIKN